MKARFESLTGKREEAAMIITCPECATRYKASEDAIGPNGRTVRCANCTTTWFVAAPAAQLTMDALSLADNQRDDIVPAPNTPLVDDSATNKAPVVTPKPKLAPKTGAHVDMRNKADRRRRNRRLTGVAAIWLVPLVLLGAMAAGAYHFRQDIVSAYPKTATVFKALGADVSLSGLILDPPETRYAEIDGTPTLIVTGSVRNIMDEALDLPMIELSLFNASDEALVQWAVEMETANLKPGERADYISQLPNPALDARYLKTQFMEDMAASTLAGQSTVKTPLQMPKTEP